MKDQRKFDFNASGFQVNTNQRGTNEQREGKDCAIRRQEVENTKPTKCKKNYKIDLKDSRSC